MIKLAFIFIVTIIAVSTSSFNFTSLIHKLDTIPKTWESGFNSKFQSLSLEQIKGMMGTILPTPEKEKLPQKLQVEFFEPPQSFDSREEWPKCESIKEIRDQSTCGSCWAFAAVEAMSDRICISSGQRSQVRLSARDVLSCCGELTCGNGCNGGHPHGAWKYFKSTGIVSDKCQSYPFAPCDHHTSGKYEPCGKIQPTPKCLSSCDGPEIDHKSDLHFGKLIYSVPSRVSDIQIEIMTNGPVEASFTVYEDFLAYKSGVYHHVEGKSLGGHAVKIIGWGVEQNVPFWEISNSWNEDWGNGGFFRIKRGTNECGIEKEIVAGIPYIKTMNVKSE